MRYVDTSPCVDRTLIMDFRIDVATPNNVRDVKVAHASLFGDNRSINSKKFFKRISNGVDGCTGFLAVSVARSVSRPMVVGVCCLQVRTAKLFEPSTSGEGAKGPTISSNSTIPPSTLNSRTASAYIFSLGVFTPFRRRGLFGVRWAEWSMVG